MNQKISFIQDSNKIWFKNSNLNSIWTRGRHVARSCLLVPVRVDHKRGASELKWFVWSRSSGTSSSKWSDMILRIQIGRTRWKRERSSPWGIDDDGPAVRVWTPASFQWFPMEMERWTVRRRSRGCRGCRRSGLPRPVLARGDDRSGADLRWFSGAGVRDVCKVRERVATLREQAGGKGDYAGEASVIEVVGWLGNFSPKSRRWTGISGLDSIWG
jgi:hypothetical protein